MASPKHLKDLLQEDQEPFQLKNYISDRYCQIKRPRTHLQIKKRKPISQNAAFPSRFCRNACFFSFHESPDARKSPLFDFLSPNRSPNPIFLNIPARTAALLVEAAVRIQKQSSEGTKTRTRSAGSAFGLFGSVLKKLTHRKKREIGGGHRGRVSVKDILRWESPIVRKIVSGNAKRGGVSELPAKNGDCEKTAFETTRSSGRSSSSTAVWSESNEEKSWDCDFETSSSSGSESDGLEEMEEVMDGGDLADCGKHFCESPFRFVLQSSPSHGGFLTPNFSSPAVTPSHRNSQEIEESYEVDQKVKKLEMEEEEEEQCSPVSVLDPPFEDDDEDVHMHNLHCNSTFRSVQRTKHQLLQKLCKFEQLAGLDPVELEKLMSDQETEEDEETHEVTDKEGTRIHRHQHQELAQRILEKYSDELKRVPGGMQTLIADLIAEEFSDNSFLIDAEAAAKRVCGRLESWRDVKSNTIDMMVELDLRQERTGFWKKNDREVQETAFEIEFTIFGGLVEELSSELVLGQ